MLREGLNGGRQAFFQEKFSERFSASLRLTLRMSANMKPDQDPQLQTRSSLLKRLKAGDDSQGWEDFYRTYGGLIRFFAEKAGLTAGEAEEVVQETAIGLARQLPEFTYDPKVCRFKTWLLNLARWRIQDQLRKRRSNDKLVTRASVSTSGTPASSSDDTAQTATVERIPDPSLPEIGAEWDAAWERNLFVQALEIVRGRIEARQFQIFDLYVTKNWPPEDVARTLGISVARVYLTKHRISAAVTREVKRLERHLEQAAERTRDTRAPEHTRPPEQARGSQQRKSP
jgi:RNA polymerase sigma factor (sigma-70 family)